MHDFCICADNTVEGKVSAVLLKHPGINCFTAINAIILRSDVHKCQFRTGTVSAFYTLRNRMLQLSFSIVCNTLFAGAAVRHL